MTLRRLRLLLPLSAACALALPSEMAGARIVVDVGIAGVRLGMTPAQVRQVVGKPNRVSLSKGRAVDYIYRASRLKLLVSFGLPSQRVNAISTSSRAQRTANGIHIGSSRDAVRRHLPSLQCTRSRCEGPLTPAGTETSLTFVGGQGVAQITVSTASF